MILTIEDLKKEKNLINDIDWDMTPEEAVRLYLEWGNIRSSIRAGFSIRSKSDYSTYFVVNCWERPFYIYLIKRNSEEAIELAKIDLPERFEKPVCELKGIYAPDEDLKQWLKMELNVDW